MSHYSPIYSRSTFTPSSSSGLHYFNNNSPTHEAQMWSTNPSLTPTSDDYGSPKGVLPGFQRITASNVHYSPTGRTNFNYGSQVSLWFFCFIYSVYSICAQRMFVSVTKWSLCPIFKLNIIPISAGCWNMGESLRNQ